MDPAQERQIRDAYAAFMRDDLDAALAGFVPESTFTNPEYAVEGGVRVGLDQVREGFRALLEQFEFSALEIEQILEGPKGFVVVARIEGRGRSSAVPLDTRFFHVLRMRGTEVLDFAWFTSLEEGRAAVGL